MKIALTPADQKVLVTGASGFVGQALCKEMLRQGWCVRAAVRQYSQLLNSAETIAIGNIDGGTDWTGALCGVDVVIHLAARVHVMHETAPDPLRLFREVNVAGTERLARCAVAAGVRRLVYVSSIKVNGEQTFERPFSERDAAHPQDAYAISKHEAETALRQIAGETGMEVVIVRPPLVYGPGVGGNFVRLLGLVQRGVPLPFGSVENARSLIYLGNFVDALIACATHPATANKTFLVKDGEDVSTPELVRRIAFALGVKPRLLPVPPALMRWAGRLVGGKQAALDRLLGSLQVDDSRIRSELGWSPPFSMAQGLEETAAWFRGRHRGE